MICYPMARFAAVVRNTPILKDKYEVQAARLMTAAAESIAVHDDQFREGPDTGEGYLYGLHLKKVLPLNMQNALARAWMASDEAGGSRRYADRIERLARFFKNRLEYRADRDVYTWSYWAELDGPGKGAEDISHASINVDFAALCAERSIVFDRQDLRRFGNTFIQFVYRSPEDIANRVDGTGQGRYSNSILRWGRLAIHNPEVLRRLLQYAHEKDKMPGSRRGLGLEYLVAAVRK